MSVRQYIGARYVPRFYENSDGSAEWRQGVAYEPLTVVTYNGNSYTSKKDVTANIGVPGENPEYWASTGIYNVQVDQYREETAQAQQTANGAVTAAQTAQQTADSAAAAAQTAQSSADDAMSAAQAAQQTADTKATAADLAALEQEIGQKFPALQNLKGANIIILGDSYASGTGSSTGGWASKFVTLTGANLIAHAYQNGGGIAALGNTNADYPNKNYAGALTEIISTLTAEQKNSVQLILVQSGWNDCSSSRNPDGSSAVVSGIQAILSAANNAFPNAKLWFIPTWNETPITVPSSWNILNDYIGIAFYWGKCCATRESINWFYGINVGAGDGIHLNDTGYLRLAQYIYALVCGWNGVLAGGSQGASNETGTSGTLYCVPVGQYAHVHGALTVSNFARATKFTTLPAKCRPSVTKYLPVMLYGASGSAPVAMARVLSNGSVDIRNTDGVPATYTNMPIYIDWIFTRNCPA